MSPTDGAKFYDGICVVCGRYHKNAFFTAPDWLIGAKKDQCKPTTPPPSLPPPPPPRPPVSYPHWLDNYKKQEHPRVRYWRERYHSLLGVTQRAQKDGARVAKTPSKRPRHPMETRSRAKSARGVGPLPAGRELEGPLSPAIRPSLRVVVEQYPVPSIGLSPHLV